MEKITEQAKIKMVKKIAIHCDLSNSSGLGHLSRMKNLSTELEKKGFKCYFLFYQKNKEYVSKHTSMLKVIFFSNKNKIKSIKHILLKNNFTILILDSYENNFFLEKTLVKHGFFVISIDDHLRKHHSNIVVTNRILENDLFVKKQNQIWLCGNKYILTARKVKKINKFRNKSKKLKILLHAGASSSYKHIKDFTVATLDAIDKYNLDASVICTTAQSKKYIKKLLTKYKKKKTVKIFQFINNLSKKISKYNLVAGPMGTTTFESIMSCTLPFSVPIKNDGRDSASSWHSLGHLAHLTNVEKKNIIIIKDMWSLIINNYEDLLNLLIKKSRQLDGLGPKRLAAKIIMYIKNNNKKIDNINLEIKKNSIYSERCKIFDIRYFFNTKNKKINKDSSILENKLTWPEHINWWLRSNIKKYKILSEGRVIGYYWIKINKDKEEIFITSDYFLLQDMSKTIQLDYKILKIQHNILKKNYKDLRWIIVAKKKYCIEPLYKKFGFYPASKKSILSIISKPSKKIINISFIETRI